MIITLISLTVNNDLTELSGEVDNIDSRITNLNYGAIVGLGEYANSYTLWSQQGGVVTFDLTPPRTNAIILGILDCYSDKTNVLVSGTKVVDTDTITVNVYNVANDNQATAGNVILRVLWGY